MGRAATNGRGAVTILAVAAIHAAQSATANVTRERTSRVSRRNRRSGTGATHASTPTPQRKCAATIRAQPSTNRNAGRSNRRFIVTTSKYRPKASTVPAPAALRARSRIAGVRKTPHTRPMPKHYMVAGAARRNAVRKNCLTVVTSAHRFGPQAAVVDRFPNPVSWSFPWRFAIVY